MNNDVDIKGVYEVGIGVPDLIEQIRFWSRFGYRVGSQGELSATECAALYGVESAVKSVHLLHQDADHGLIRLMQWDKPTNSGIGITYDLRQEGGRWTVQLTDSTLELLNHAEDAKARGLPWNSLYPHWIQVYPMDKGEPFIDPPIGVREALIAHPLARIAPFERYNYEKPGYGTIDPHSFLKTSQFTHYGTMIRADDDSILDFYEKALGLLRQKEYVMEGGAAHCVKGAADIFALKENEVYYVTDFDDPRSSLEIKQHRSGRLKFIRLKEECDMPVVWDRQQPGSLGMSLFTYRVKSAEDFRERVIDGGASNVTDILPNEFGKLSFSFVAPEGSTWNLIEDPTAFN
ncbi:MAG: VOC family protein [Pseudomonadota bacterium]